VTKREKNLSRFLYHTKDHLAYFSEKKNGWWERPLLPFNPDFLSKKNKKPNKETKFKPNTSEINA